MNPGWNSICKRNIEQVKNIGKNVVYIESNWIPDPR